MNQITYVLPEKIAAKNGDIENVGSLLKPKAVQIGLGESDVATIKGPARIVFDFGRELCGGIRILAHYITNGKPIGIRFGESLSEAITPLGVKTPRTIIRRGIFRLPPATLLFALRRNGLPFRLPGF